MNRWTNSEKLLTWFHLLLVTQQASDQMILFKFIITYIQRERGGEKGGEREEEREKERERERERDIIVFVSLNM